MAIVFTVMSFALLGVYEINLRTSGTFHDNVAGFDGDFDAFWDFQRFLRVNVPHFVCSCVEGEMSNLYVVILMCGRPTISQFRKLAKQRINVFPKPLCYPSPILWPITFCFCQVN